MYSIVRALFRAISYCLLLQHIAMCIRYIFFIIFAIIIFMVQSYGVFLLPTIALLWHFAYQTYGKCPFF